MTEITAPGRAGAVGVPFRDVALCLAAMIYPWLLALSFDSFQNFRAGAPGAWAPAVVWLVAAFAVPGLALARLVALGGAGTPTPAEVRSRRLALLVFASPPLFTATGVYLFIIAPAYAQGHLVWAVIWTALIAAVIATRAKPSAAVASAPPIRLRVAHGIVALAVLVGYVGLHLGNHLAALVGGAELHRAIQTALRHWYQAPAVEVALVALMVFLVVSGLSLARWHTAQPGLDGWRALQLASGAYMAAFLVSHMSAGLILARHVTGTETDWAWASGLPAGLLGDAWNIRLIPHYALVVVLVLLHAGLGARVVALAHEAKPSLAGGVAVLAGVVGVAASTAIVAAQLGVRL